jgi:hypothetical protein
MQHPIHIALPAPSHLSAGQQSPARLQEPTVMIAMPIKLPPRSNL